MGIGLGQGPCAELAGAALDGAEQRAPGVVRDPRPLQVGVQVLLQGVVAGHRMGLAALFLQADPQPPILRVDVLDAHGQGRADPGEGEHHQADQGPIAPADRRVGLDARQQLPGLGRVEHRGLAGAHAVPGAAHRGGRIQCNHLPRHQPVKEMAQRGQALLDRRRGVGTRLLLDPGRHVQRLHRVQGRHPSGLAPGEKVPHRAGVGPPGVRVADLRGEEFEKAQLGVCAGGDHQGGQPVEGPGREQ